MARMTTAQKNALAQQRAANEEIEMRTGYPQLLINALHKALSRGPELTVDSRSGDFYLYLGSTRYVFGKEFSQRSYSQLQDYLDEIAVIEDEENYLKRRQDRYNQVKAKLSSVLSPEELEVLNEGEPSSWVNSDCWDC